MATMTPVSCLKSNMRTTRKPRISRRRRASLGSQLNPQTNATKRNRQYQWAVGLRNCTNDKAVSDTAAATAVTAPRGRNRAKIRQDCSNPNATSGYRWLTSWSPNAHNARALAKLTYPR